MDPREFAAAQNRETRKISATVRRAVVRDGAPVTEAQREALAKQLLPKVKRSRVRVRDLGVEFMETQAAAADVELAPQPIRDYESRAIVKVLERATGAPDEKSSERRKVSVVMADPKTRNDVRKRVTVTDENRHDPIVKKAVGDRAAASVGRHVRNAAREAVSDAAEVAGTEVGWARVLSGAESCPWCAMLASRGPVYGSADSAGFVTQRSGRYDAHEAKAFHDWCDCVIVPVFEGVPWHGEEHFELLEDLWIKSTEGLTAPDSAKAFAKALKKTHLTKLPDSDTDTSSDQTFDPTPNDQDAPSIADATPEPDLVESIEPEVDAGSVSADTRAAVEQAQRLLPRGKSEWESVDTLRTDRNGEYLPSVELLGHLDSVTTVGRAINADVKRRSDADSELVEWRHQVDSIATEVDAARKVKNHLEAGRAQKRALPLLEQIARRESAYFHEALAEVRDLGGHKQDVRTFANWELEELNGRVRQQVRKGGADGVAALREAERFYPTEWLKAAASRGIVNLGNADRGFFLHKSPSLLNNDTLVMQAAGMKPYVAGAHSSDAIETAIHELGHRMEAAVPGLMQLEFALARSRSTKNGVLEDPQPISMGSSEVAYPDKWERAYAGRSYAPAGSARPDLTPHEVFQVGTQDLFGRSQVKFGDDQLQEFVMGVLALL